MKQLIIYISFLLCFSATSQDLTVIAGIVSQQDSDSIGGGTPPSGDTDIVLNDLRAFPSAFGGGAFARVDPTIATIYEVTNLNTDGPGSFREAFEASGPRIAIIKVEGRVNDLEEYSEFDGSGDIAVWGQMAPGLGMTISHPRMTYTRSGNIIFRFMTLDTSNGLPCTVNQDCFDALNYLQIENETSNYVDHCSLRYGLDQTWTLSTNIHSQGGDASLNRSTFVYNLLAEADPSHSTASILNRQGDTPTSTDIGKHTWARNMTHDISHRFPNINPNGDFEVFNNYYTNWGWRLTRINTHPSLDYHRNYARRGNRTAALGSPTQRGNKIQYNGAWDDSPAARPMIFSAFNCIEGINVAVASTRQEDIWQWHQTSTGDAVDGVSVIQNGPVPTTFFIETQQHSLNPPADGYWNTLDVPAKMEASVGHNRGINSDGTPFYGRDDLDTNYFVKVNTNNTNTAYRETNEWTFTSFPGTAMYTDSDGDHMPDWFENQHAHLNPNNASDMLTTHVSWTFSEGYTVTNNAGYTNLEMCAEYYAGGFESMIDGTNNMNLGDN